MLSLEEESYYFKKIVVYLIFIIYFSIFLASKALSLGTRSLYGCVQQIEIDGEPIIFEVKNAKKWHKIITNGCPFV